MPEAVSLNSSDLRQGSYNITVPFIVDVDTSKQHQQIRCEEVLRLLPGKRVVCRGQINNNPVLVKLFVDRTKHRRHASRGLSGLRAMASAGCKVPDIKLEGTLSDGEGSVIGLQFLSDAKTLQSHWKDADESVRIRLIKESLQPIARLHQSGLMQTDIHLDNFIESHQSLFCIDGGGVDIRHQGEKLPFYDRLKNLALYFAQLPSAYDVHIKAWLTVYNQVIDEKPLPLYKVLKTVTQLRLERVSNYCRKSYRNCTEFKVRKQWRRYSVIRRDIHNAQWQQFLDDPDRFIKTGHLLKSGHSATVVVSDINGKKVLIKRYNLKDFMHRIKRCWQPTRGWRSWGNAQMLKMLGIRTPRPLALVEERFGPLRGRAFLVTEFFKGENILTHFFRQDLPKEQLTKELPEISRLFEKFMESHISHGDMKGTNLLIAHGKLTVIDLDSMSQHHQVRSFRRAFDKDIKRFMKNWQANDALYDQFKKRLLPVLHQKI